MQDKVALILSFKLTEFRPAEFNVFSFFIFYFYLIGNKNVLKWTKQIHEKDEAPSLDLQKLNEEIKIDLI